MHPRVPDPGPWRRRGVFFLAGAVWCLAAVGGHSAEGWAWWGGKRRAEREKATAEALRVLQSNCLGCHNAEKSKGGLALHSQEALLAGGDSGKVVIPRKPDKSPLWLSLAPGADPHMPPKKQLSTGQVASVRRWIEGGARWDAELMARLTGPRGVVLEPGPPDYRPVLGLALNADGTRVAFGRGHDLLVRSTEATNATTRVVGGAHRDTVRAVAWSGDGRWVASGGFRELVVRDAASLEIAWSTTSNLTGRITALRFSPHHGALMVADGGPAQPGWVRVYAAESGRPLAAWVAHGDSVLDLAVTADGGLLATAGGDKLVKLWELLSQKEVGRFEGHVGAVVGVAFHPTAAELVSVGADKQLKLWDIKTGEAVVTMGGRRHGFTSVAWAADGSRVVTGDEAGQLTSFSGFKRHTGEQSSATAEEKALGSWAGPLHAVGVTRDGATAYAGSESGVVRAVTAKGKLVAEFAAEAAKAAEAAAAAVTNAVADAGAPSFVYDVLPVLAKAGCSAGSCHAKADGQNGFKLSVFSYDPKADFAELVTEGRGRRVFPAAPDESLVLLKSTGRVEHGGGQRIEPGSEWESLVRRWIRAGMPYQRPNEPALVAVEVEPKEGTYARKAVAKLTVRARYSDGSERDVTGLAEYFSNEKEIVQVDERGGLEVGTLGGEGVVVARFSGLVAASRVAVPSERVLPEERYRALPVYNFVDEHAYAQFRKLGLFPSELCSDAEFLRRSTLDTIGVLPTAEEAREFLAGATGSGVAEGEGESVADRERGSRERRAAWVEKLLTRPEFADFWANKWADLLRPNPDRVGVKSVFVLDQWLREWFRSGRPFDEFARELIVAEGSNHRDGPAVVYRDRREPPELTTLFGQLFLGVRMECAKCHHHPNEKWSQDDFYRFAAVFGPVKQKGAGLSPPISAGTETFFHAPGGKVRHPVTGQEMKPAAPDGPEFGGDEPGADPRRAFVDWLTGRGNPFFARAAVNRVWAAFFGRGIVEPVDDFRVSNPASNEPLLAALAEDFETHGYDPKQVVRTVLNSRLYQLGTTPNEWNMGDTKNFSRSYRRRLPAEVLLDAVNDVTGIGDEFAGCPPGTRAMQTWSYKIGSQFLDAFGRPNASSDCPCERDVRTSVVQALHLMNSKRLHEKLADPAGRARRLAAGPGSPAEIVTELYWVVFGRPPAADELESATKAFAGVSDAAGRNAATEDVLWALLNSAEFVFNH